MGKLDDRVRAELESFLRRGEPAVRSSHQGVTRERIGAALEVLGMTSRDIGDAVFALLDDTRRSWFPTAAGTLRFCDGASIAHIACHVGILQRQATKLDREGRDYWIKPLRRIVAVEPVTLDGRSRTFVVGHPIPKSPNSAYRLHQEFVRVLQAPESNWSDFLASWSSEGSTRSRLAFQVQCAAAATSARENEHGALINACIHRYAKRFLPGFDVLYVDDSDGDRISQEEHQAMREAGLEFRLDDARPDVLLYNHELDELWVIEAVTSDGEVDDWKVDQMVRFADRHGKAGVGFTTAYTSWRSAAARQHAHKNIPPGTYVWIRDDGSKHYRAEDFGDGSRPSTIPSRSS